MFSPRPCRGSPLFCQQPTQAPSLLSSASASRHRTDIYHRANVTWDQPTSYPRPMSGTPRSPYVCWTHTTFQFGFKYRESDRSFTVTMEMTDVPKQRQNGTWAAWVKSQRRSGYSPGRIGSDGCRVMPRFPGSTEPRRHNGGIHLKKTEKNWKQTSLLGCLHSDGGNECGGSQWMIIKKGKKTAPLHRVKTRISRLWSAVSFLARWFLYSARSRRLNKSHDKWQVMTSTDKKEFRSQKIAFVCSTFVSKQFLAVSKNTFWAIVI